MKCRKTCLNIETGLGAAFRSAQLQIALKVGQEDLGAAIVAQIADRGAPSVGTQFTAVLCKSTSVCVNEESRWRRDGSRQTVIDQLSLTARTRGDDRVGIGRGSLRRERLAVPSQWPLTFMLKKPVNRRPRKRERFDHALGRKVELRQIDLYEPARCVERDRAGERGLAPAHPGLFSEGVGNQLNDFAKAPMSIVERQMRNARGKCLDALPDEKRGRLVCSEHTPV